MSSAKCAPALVGREALDDGIVDLLQRDTDRWGLRLICAAPGVTSGRTALLFSELAKVTRRDHFCALVDARSSLDSISARTAGIRLDRLMWVRCRLPERRGKKDSDRSHQIPYADRHNDRDRHSNRDRHSDRNDRLDTDVLQSEKPCQKELGELRVGKRQIHRQTLSQQQKGREHTGEQQTCKRHYEEQVQKMRGLSRTGGITNRENRRFDLLEQAFKAADILVQNGGFEMIAVDLSDIEERRLRKVPLTTWFRFARVAEKTQTSLVFLTSYPAAHLCAAITLHMTSGRTCWKGEICDSPVRLCAPEPLAQAAAEPFERSNKSSEPAEEELRLAAKNSPIVTASAFQRDLSSQEKVNDDIRQNVKEAFHMQVLEGAECEIGIAHARKPVQKERPKFMTNAMWK